jgi:hypothetical protein
MRILPMGIGSRAEGLKTSSAIRLKRSIPITGSPHSLVPTSRATVIAAQMGRFRDGTLMKASSSRHRKKTMSHISFQGGGSRVANGS